MWVVGNICKVVTSPRFGHVSTQIRQLATTESAKDREKRKGDTLKKWNEKAEETPETQLIEAADKHWSDQIR